MLNFRSRRCASAVARSTTWSPKRPRKPAPRTALNAPGRCGRRRRPPSKRAAFMAAQTTAIDSRNWLLTRRWLLVASAMLFLWIIAQIDKTNVSLIIADSRFLKELNLVGHNAELGGLMSTFFIGCGFSLFAGCFLVARLV